MKNKDLSCVACKGIMVNKGKIPDGILFVCKNCNSKRIYIENIKQLQDVDSYGNAYREKFDQAKVLSQLRLLHENLSAVENKKDILDIGCGNGAFIKALIEHGYSASGLECDSRAVKDLLAEGIDVHLGELGQKIEINRCFKIVTLWDLIEHINDVENAVLQLRSLVEKNGIVIILTPDSDSIFDLFATIERLLTFNKSQRLMNICLNRYHLHRFSVTGLKIMLQNNGFIVNHVHKLQLFSLKRDAYMNGFAPGLKKWTFSSSLNKFLSRSIITLIKTLNIHNKILITAVKT